MVVIIVIVAPLISHDLIRAEFLAAALAGASHATRDPGIVLHLTYILTVDWLAPAVGLRLAAITARLEALLPKPLVPSGASVTIVAFGGGTSLEPLAPDHVEMLGVFTFLKHRLLILEQVLVHLDLVHQVALLLAQHDLLKVKKTRRCLLLVRQVIRWLESWAALGLSKSCRLQERKRPLLGRDGASSG